MPFAELSTNHYQRDTLGEAEKLCVNLYPEANSSDPLRRVKLVTTPGTADKTGAVSLSGVRGLDQSDGHASGKILVTDGSTVRTYDRSTDEWGTLSGTVAGTDRTQWAFSEVQGALLSNGLPYFSNGTSVTPFSDTDYSQLLADHNQTGFSSVASLGQRFLLTYGSRFAYTDVLDGDDITTINFYTAESNPDTNVAGFVVGERYWVIGTETMEPWFQTGINDEPFRRQSGGVIQRGAMARDTIQLMDSTLYWVADDRTVRRLNGITPERISPNWVDRLLKSADASKVIARVYETEGHAFYCLNGPGWCAVFDSYWAGVNGAANAWHRRRSITDDTGGWDWAYIVDVDGRQFAASRDGGRFVELSRDYLSDDMPGDAAFGQEIVRQGSFHIPIPGGRTPVPSIRFDGSIGVGLLTGQGSDPIIQMRLSKDNGRTFGDWRNRSAGKLGKYGQRVIWRRNGHTKEPQVIGQFRMSDPVPWVVTGWAVGED